MGVSAKRALAFATSPYKGKEGRWKDGGRWEDGHIYEQDGKGRGCEGRIDEEGWDNIMAASKWWD